MSYEQESNQSPVFFATVFAFMCIGAYAIYFSYGLGYSSGIDDTKSEMHCQPIPTVGTMDEAKKRVEYNWKRFQEGKPVPLAPRG